MTTTPGAKNLLAPALLSSPRTIGVDMLDDHMQPIRPVARLHREFDGDLRPAGVSGSGKVPMSALAAPVVCSQPRPRQVRRDEPNQQPRPDLDHRVPGLHPLILDHGQLGHRWPAGDGRPGQLAARVRLLSSSHGRKNDDADAISIGIAAMTAAHINTVQVDEPSPRHGPRCR